MEFEIRCQAQKLHKNKNKKAQNLHVLIVN